MDVLSYMEKIPVCTAYEIDGERTKLFPVGERLDRAKPVIEELEGWQCDISGCRTVEELPRAARAYVRALEALVDCPITTVSVGAGREEYIKWKD